MALLNLSLTTIKIGEYIFYFTSTKHLDLIVTNGKFTKTEDLVILSMLLGQNTTRTSTFSMGSNKSINKKRNRSLPFAENFVNVQWIELLEKGMPTAKVSMLIL